VLLYLNVRRRKKFNKEKNTDKAMPSPSTGRKIKKFYVKEIREDSKMKKKKKKKKIHKREEVRDYDDSKYREQSAFVKRKDSHINIKEYSDEPVEVSKWSTNSARPLSQTASNGKVKEIEQDNADDSVAETVSVSDTKDLEGGESGIVLPLRQHRGQSGDKDEPEELIIKISPKRRKSSRKDKVAVPYRKEPSSRVEPRREGKMMQMVRSK